MRIAFARLLVTGCLLAGCSAGVQSRDTSAAELERALVERPVPEIMAARALVRDVARGCEGVALHPVLEPRIDVIRRTRKPEFDAITSGSVIGAARPFSAAFDRRHGQAFKLLTRRGPPPPDLCRAARAEAGEPGLMGLMLVRT